jgi:CMP/dCMP kinase
MESIVIAIDGPSGTGKSIVAKLLAEKIKFQYIDSGIYYRAVTYWIIKNNIKPNEIAKICDFVKNAKLEIKDESVFLNGEDITKSLRNIEVTNKVSSVSKLRNLRKIIALKLREFTFGGNLIMDGKDIGTVVFPGANIKFFIICDDGTRVARRQQEFLDVGQKISKSKMLQEMLKRDELDRSRQEGPLKKADDAVEIDTTNMIVEEQVDFLNRKLIAKGLLE